MSIEEVASGADAASTAAAGHTSPDAASGESTGPSRSPAPALALPVGSSASDALAVLKAAVDALAVASDPSFAGGRLDGPAAVEVVREALTLAGRLSAIAARVVPVVEADGWWALDGARSITTWVATQGRLPHAHAARLVALGRAFRDHLPDTAAAATAGAVPVEAAHALAAVANTDARRAALAAPAEECGEGFLLEHAQSLPVSQFRLLTRRWAAQADPAADDDGYTEASDREFLTVSQTTDGCHLAGFLTTEHGHALQAALTALAGRSADQARQPAGRRRARALVNLTRLALDRDLTGATGDHRPHITAVVDLDTLRRALDRAQGAPGQPDGAAAGASLDGPSAPRQPDGAATGASLDGQPAHQRRRRRRAAETAAEPVSRGPLLDTGAIAGAELVGTGPIPDTVLARLACDSSITRVVFGPQSQVLNVGRAERTYTGVKRRAIVARDRHCQYPDCDAPPALAEVHHTKHWVRDNGATDVHTGCLLCWHHHAVVHDRAIEIARRADGSWQFTDRHGHPLRT